MRRELVGIIAAFCMTLSIIALYVLISSAVEQRSQDREWYSECVRTIPAYLDAQEILYQEQECKVGVRSANP